MSDGSRQHDDEPLTATETTVDVALDTSMLEDPDTDPARPRSPADAEPKTLEPVKKLGVKRLRAPTLVGVAPPSLGGQAPPPTQRMKQQPAAECLNCHPRTGSSSRR